MIATAKPRQVYPARSKPPVGFPLLQWSVEQYEEMIRTGVLTPDQKVELLDGWIVEKMPHSPEHIGITRTIRKRIARELPDEWDVDSQCPVRLIKSMPEPDVAIFIASSDNYRIRHPIADDISTVIEVSLTSIFRDRVEKARLYAEAGIPEYWIVNVAKGYIEVFTDPANGKKWRYRIVKQYGKNDMIPLVLRGKKVADIPVRELV